MSPPGCQKMSAKPCNRNAEERFPVLSLKGREQKPPNPLLIQDKNVLQPSPALAHQPAWMETVVEVLSACVEVHRPMGLRGSRSLALGAPGALLVSPTPVELV